MTSACRMKGWRQPVGICDGVNMWKCERHHPANLTESLFHCRTNRIARFNCLRPEWRLKNGDVWRVRTGFRDADIRHAWSSQPCLRKQPSCVWVRDRSPMRARLCGWEGQFITTTMSSFAECLSHWDAVDVGLWWWDTTRPAVPAVVLIYVTRVCVCVYERERERERNYGTFPC